MSGYEVHEGFPPARGWSTEFHAARGNVIEENAHKQSGAEAIVVVVDLTADVTTQLLTVLEELAEACVHPIPGPMSTVLHGRGKGGIKFLGESLTRDEETTARAILAEAHVEHAEVIVRGATWWRSMRAAPEQRERGRGTV